MRYKRTQFSRESIFQTESLIVECPEVPTKVLKGSSKLKTVEKAIPKRLFTENNGEEITVREWGNLFIAPGSNTVNKEYSNIDIKVFRMTENGMSKVEWKNLHPGMKKAFREVINTFFSDTDPSDKLVRRSECFTFSYSDSEVVLSVMCVILNKSMTFYYN